MYGYSLREAHEKAAAAHADKLMEGGAARLEDIRKWVAAVFAEADDFENVLAIRNRLKPVHENSVRRLVKCQLDLDTVEQQYKDEADAKAKEGETQVKEERRSGAMGGHEGVLN